jgi:type I restriction enzyme S subunit
MLLQTLSGRKPRFYKGDIVYGYLRPYLNKVWIAEFDGLCSVDQYAYKVNDRLAIALYISCFLRSSRFLEAAPVSSAPGQLPRIRSEEIDQVIIPLPPLSEQNTIAAKIDAQLRSAALLRAGLESQLLELDALPAALLRKAFSGEL